MNRSSSSSSSSSSNSSSRRSSKNDTTGGTLEKQSVSKEKCHRVFSRHMPRTQWNCFCSHSFFLHPMQAPAHCAEWRQAPAPCAEWRPTSNYDLAYLNTSSDASAHTVVNTDVSTSSRKGIPSDLWHTTTPNNNNSSCIQTQLRTV